MGEFGLGNSGFVIRYIIGAFRLFQRRSIVLIQEGSRSYILFIAPPHGREVLLDK